MSLEKLEDAYQREHADPVRGYIGLIAVLLFTLVPLGCIGYLIHLAFWMSCQQLPQFCK